MAITVSKKPLVKPVSGIVKKPVVETEEAPAQEPESVPEIKKPVMVKNSPSATKVEMKQATGTITHQYKDGSVTEETEVVKEAVPYSEPTANVGVSIALTRNLGNYESLKVSVSLFMPCIASEEEVNNTYDECKNWVDNRINLINEEITEQIGHGN